MRHARDTNIPSATQTWQELKNGAGNSVGENQAEELLLEQCLMTLIAVVSELGEGAAGTAWKPQRLEISPNMHASRYCRSEEDDEGGVVIPSAQIRMLLYIIIISCHRRGCEKEKDIGSRAKSSRGREGLIDRAETAIAGSRSRRRVPSWKTETHKTELDIMYELVAKIEAGRILLKSPHIFTENFFRSHIHSCRVSCFLQLTLRRGALITVIVSHQRR